MVIIFLLRSISWIGLVPDGLEVCGGFDVV